jgi:3-methyladenine DNA glycosylase AlkD
MNKNDVLTLLKSHRNERGILNWEKTGAETQGLKSFGIGLTQLRKLAREIGRDHELALELWESGNETRL